MTIKVSDSPLERRKRLRHQGRLHRRNYPENTRGSYEKLQEALELYFEEFPEKKEEYTRILRSEIFYGTVEVASQPVR